MSEAATKIETNESKDSGGPPPQKKARLDGAKEAGDDGPNSDAAKIPGNPPEVKPTAKAPALDGLKTSDDSEANAAKGEEKLDEKHTFPERLMYLLQNETDPDALWWQPDGDSFAFEPNQFTEKVLTKLPGGKIKFESFIRKLNRWGFRRVPGQGLPPNGAAYKHPLFKKSDPELMKTMKFGQKGDAPKPNAPAYALDPGTAGAVAAGHLPAALHQAFGNHQALQAIQQQALLQSMLQRQQRQMAVDFLAQQQFASNSLNHGGADLEAQLRNRILQGSLLSTLPSMHASAPAGMPQQQNGRAGGGDHPEAAANQASSTDADLLARLILSAGLPAAQAQAHAQFLAMQQQEGQAAPSASAPSAAGAAAAPGPAASAATADLRARLLLGAGFSSSLHAQVPQFSASSTDQTLQQQASGDNELVRFLEQQRQRAERENSG